MYIGIDIGGTAIKAGLVDEKCNIIVKGSIPTRAREGCETIAEDIAELSKKLLKQSGYSIDDVVSIGMGCPGTVDDKEKIVIYANNLNLTNAPLGKAVSDLMGVPVYLGNDANCAALGEFYALNDDSLQNFVAVTLGTGVGGGIVINRKLYTGSNGEAGELGHIMIKSGGEACTCGREGCWEAYASVTALVRDAERAAKANPDSLLAKLVAKNGGKANGKIPFDAMRDGDGTAKSVVDNYIQYVAAGIVDVINIFRPEVLVIGGGISKEGDTLLNPVLEYAKKYVYGETGADKKIDIRIAKLGNDAGIVGAALLGIG